MKECKYCGTKYREELDVCPNCGGNLIVTAEGIAESAELVQKEKENHQRSVIEPQNHLKKLIGIIAGVIAAIIVIVVIASYAHNHRAVNGDLSRADMAEAYEQGMTYYNNKDYVSAIAELGKVSAESRYYDEASAILQEAVEIYSDDALSKASTYANVGDYKMACSILENALQIVPSNSTLTAELISYQETFRNQLRSSTLEVVEGSIAENDYPTAIQTLSAALEELSNDVELNALLENCSDEYRYMVLAEADAALGSEGYEAAIAVARQGLIVLTNDTLLLQAIERYETYTPVWLCDLDYFDIEGFWGWSIGQTKKDNLGNDHDHCIGPDWNWLNEPYYIVYKLNGEYSKLCGTYFVLYDQRAYDGTVTLSIYGDNELLWEGDMKRGMDPEDVAVDLTNVKELKLVADGNVALMAYLGDVSLYP